MKTTIHKFNIHPKSLPSIMRVMVPANSLFIKADVDPLGSLSLWTIVALAAELKEFSFTVIGTGQEVPIGKHYMDTVVDGYLGLVYHVFSDQHIIYRNQLINML